MTIRETDHPKEVHITCEVCGQTHLIRCCDGGQANDFELPGFRALRDGGHEIGHVCPGCAAGLDTSLPFLKREYGLETELQMEQARFRREPTDVSKKAGSKKDA